MGKLSRGPPSAPGREVGNADRSLLGAVFSQCSLVGPSRRRQLPTGLSVQPLLLGHPLELLRPHESCGFNTGVHWLSASQLFPHVAHSYTIIQLLFLSPHLAVKILATP